MYKTIIQFLLILVDYLSKVGNVEVTPVTVAPIVPVDTTVDPVVEEVEQEEEEVQEEQPTHLIEDDKFTGIEFYPTKNMGDPIRPSFLIIHYTANDSLANTVKHFQNANSSVSAHLIIDRDGKVVQMVPFNRAAWHAGESRWGDIVVLNGHSIGIELVNWGLLEKGYDGTLYTWTSEEISKEDCRRVYDGDKAFWWQQYTMEQLEVCFNVARDLVKHYGLKEILGHNEIAPGRKVDPGPLFPIINLREYCYKK